MEITIHRGTNQIGGCVTEINQDGYKLFIDLGEELPGKESSGELAIEGLTKGNTSKSALFITHYHADHIGKLLEAQSDVPVYMGETALEIYSCSSARLRPILQPDGIANFMHLQERLQKANRFKAGQMLHWGPIRVTPLMIDHSAFDAYMFVIEAGGTRLLYTGDFRGHGFRSKAIPKMLAVYAKNIDYVISEGTNVYRTTKNESEQSLQHRFTEEFRRSKCNFVLTASTNIDRAFSLYHAAYQAGRVFVCDSYQESLMKIVASHHEAYTNFYKMRQTVYVLKRGKDGSFYFPEKLLRLMKWKGFCMMIRDNAKFWNIVAKFDGDSEQTIYYSLWKGYIDPDSSACNEKLCNALAHYPDYKYMHTSGHCDIQTLEKLFRQVKPRKGIIPIHTEHPDRFETLFGEIAPVILLRDGETYKCH